MVFTAEKQSSQYQHQTTDGGSTNAQKSVSYSNKGITHNQKLEMFHLYTNTETTVSSIAKRFNITPPVVYHHLDRLGLPYKRRKSIRPQLGTRTHNRILRMRQDGFSPKTIAETLGVSDTTVYRTLAKKGKPVRPAATNKRTMPYIPAVQKEPELPIQMIDPPIGRLKRFARWLMGH